MSGPYLSANGARVVDLDLSMSYYGAAVADISLATVMPIAAVVALVVGNLTLAMAPLRQRTFAGVTYARLVGGAGGWQRPVTIGPYALPQLSHVLADLAKATGETVRLAAGLDRPLGAFFVPEPNAPAARALSAVAGPLWWIDPAGVTQIANTRPSIVIASQASVTELDGGKGLANVATEDPAGWQPGNTFTSATVPQAITVRESHFKSGNDGVLRVEILYS